MTREYHPTNDPDCRCHLCMGPVYRDLATTSAADCRPSRYDYDAWSDLAGESGLSASELSR